MLTAGCGDPNGAPPAGEENGGRRSVAGRRMNGDGGLSGAGDQEETFCVYAQIMST